MYIWFGLAVVLIIWETPFTPGIAPNAKLWGELYPGDVMKTFGSTELGQATAQSVMLNPEPSSKPGF
jgi:hypothetical protein